MKWIALALLGAVVSAAAQHRQLTVAWDRNAEPEVAGYILHVGGASRSYTNTVDVGNTNQVPHQFPIGKTIYVAVTAYVQVGDTRLESDFSEELAVRIPNQPTRLRVQINLQSTAALDEPWIDESFAATFDFPYGDQRFYRSIVSMVPE